MQMEEYMQMALDLAALAKGRTSPNPMVGAVVVKDGRVVGQGWHKKAGTEHAEVHALRQAGDAARGADIYVTLEPCSHYGRTGPCSKALIDAGVRRVFVAMEDPNPLVAGKGIKMLRDAGIEVQVGIKEKEARKLNEFFLKWIVQKMPFVTMKTAMTLDGKIATTTGESKWISGEASRAKVHQFRDLHDAILVGIGTVLADHPALTTRLADGSGKNPLRVIVDSQARIPLTEQVLTDGLAPVIIAVTKTAKADKIAALKNAGAEVWVINEGPRVDLTRLLQRLGERSVSSVFVEGGAAINFSMLAAGLVDKVYTFIAPKLLGGAAAPTPVGGDGVSMMKDALLLQDMQAEAVGQDLLISGYIIKAGEH